MFVKNSLPSFLRVLSFLLLTSVLISFNLWTNDRTFEVFPIIKWISFPYYLSKLIQLILVAILFVLICCPKPKYIKILCVLFILLILEDQMRLQPWVYFYLLVLLPFISTKEKNTIVNYLRILFIGTYIWSGFFKFNPNFDHLIFESILIDGLRIYDPITIYSIKSFAFVIPIIEILMAIFLLFHRTRKIGVGLSISSHLLILFYLDFGLQGNWVIVPWNIFMIFSVVFLFRIRKEKFEFKISHQFLKATLTLALLLPFGYFNDYVDQRLSFSLYDGRLRSLYQLNSGSDTHYETLNDLIINGSIIDYNFWSFKELNVPFYPENRFIQKIKKSQKDNSTLIVTDLPSLETKFERDF